MTFHNDELDNLLEEKLNLLQPTPPRDPELARHQRDEYIKKVQVLQFGRPVFALIALFNRRPWQTLFSSQRPSLIPFAAAILVIFGLVFGSVGTVYAAQDSLPNDLLYSVKLTGENLRLVLTSDTEARISLLTSYADRRMEEATTLALLGQPVPDDLPVLVDAYLEEIFALTASLDEETTQEALKGIQIHLRDQDQDMTNAMNGLPEGLDPQITQLHSMMKERQQFAQMGVGEPNTFQHPFRFQEENPTTLIAGTLTSTITTTLEITVTRTITPGMYGPAPCEVPGECDPPGAVYGPGPFRGTPPVPDDPEGYGPGPLLPEETPMQGEPPPTPLPANDSSSKFKGKDGGAPKKGK